MQTGVCCAARMYFAGSLLNAVCFPIRVLSARVSACVCVCVYMCVLVDVLCCTVLLGSSTSVGDAVCSNIIAMHLRTCTQGSIEATNKLTLAEMWRLPMVKEVAATYFCVNVLRYALSPL